MATAVCTWAGEGIRLSFLAICTASSSCQEVWLPGSVWLPYPLVSSHCRLESDHWIPPTDPFTVDISAHCQFPPETFLLWNKLGIVAHICNPRTLRGCGRRILSTSLAWATWQFNETISKNKKRARIVAQCEGSGFNPVLQNETKQINKTNEIDFNIIFYVV